MTQPTHSAESRRQLPCSSASLDRAAAPSGSPSLHRYLRRITIDGIDNYLRATGKFEKRFWLLIILIGTCGTLTYLVPAFAQYLQYTTVLDIQYRTNNPDLYLPNTWICRAAVNYTYFYDRFDRVKPRLRSDPRVQLFAKRLTAIWKRVYQDPYDITFENVVDLMMAYITMSPFADGYSWIRNAQPQFLNELLYKAIEAMGSEWSGIRKFYEDGFLDCPSVLKNCSLNGIPIDCCRDSVSGHNAMDLKCYKIDLRRELLENPNLKMKRGEPIELSIETFVDNRYQAQEAARYAEETVIQVSFQTNIPWGYDQINYLAVGTASKINVKGTRKHRLFDCIDRYRFRRKLHADADPLVQQYFKDMQDQEKYTMEHCTGGKLIEAMSTRCGCVPYIDTLKPNDTVICTPAHIYACYYGAFQDTDEMEAIVKDAGVQQKDIFVDLKTLIASECAQLCDTWSYETDVFSTIMDGDEGDISEYWRNKVTVIFDPEYRVEIEMLKMDVHAFLASIGDGLGLILGMSFISFVQLAVWTVAALCSRRRLRRVRPSEAFESIEGVEMDRIPGQNESSDEFHLNGSNPKVSITITEIG